MKSLLLFAGTMLSLALASQAAPAYSPCSLNGHVGEIRLNNNSQFQFVMYDLPNNNGSKVITVIQSSVGAELFKMMHSSLQLAISTGKEIWVGTKDANSSTSGCQESWEALAITLFQN